MAGFLTAPLAATLVAERYKINRALVMLPFAVLIATCGLEYLLAASRTTWRLAAVLIVVLVPVQFYFFYADYFTDYRVRSSPWFERNIRGALEAIIDRDGREHIPAVYFDTDIQWVNENWQLYLYKHRREDLRARSSSVHPKDLNLDTVPTSSLILVRSNPEAEAPLVGSHVVRKVETITEPDGTPSFSIFQK